MRRQIILLLLAPFLLIFTDCRALAQAPLPNQVQVGPPVRRVEPPSPTASAGELEKRADELRGEKAYPDSLDYFRAALVKNPDSPTIYNKMGIVELQTMHLKEAKKNFERAIKLKRDFADAYNNLAVVYYEQKKYGKAIKLYTKAIDIDQSSASFFSNLGAAYFSKKEFEKATLAYAHAIQLDPDIFERTSRTGVAAQLPSPEDRARYNYTMAKLYAKIGLTDRSLQFLRRAMEDGYKDIRMVYKDAEFSALRKDPRFAELMAAKPPAIPE
ncbi:MAG TPA: tetratricopeptide repeat protein [Terriglobales bacterium]|jgi:tetratricopeptide (TPR) repeat protein|nr:tetratricopeptide repeat protein [Terriglobales bacterium]